MNQLDPVLRCIIGLLLIAGLPSPVTAALAQDEEAVKANSAAMARLIQYAAGSGNEVDRALHDKFWALVPDSVKKDPNEFFQRFDLVTEIAFQKELWESIQLSARAKSVVKTASYQLAKERAFAANGQGQEMSARADRMLADAATGEPYHGRAGDVTLTEEYARQVLIGVDESYAQLQLLLNPVWQGR